MLKASNQRFHVIVTMGTYTDAGLLDTAEAVESLPSFPITKTASSLVEPMVAPNLGKKVQFVSFPDHSGDENLTPTDNQETKKPRETLGFAGFSEKRLMRFELTTTTLATLCSTN